MSRQVSEMGGRKSVEAEIDLVRPLSASAAPEMFQMQRALLKCEQLEKCIKERDALTLDYYSKLFNIYMAFKVDTQTNPNFPISLVLLNVSCCFY